MTTIPEPSQTADIVVRLREEAEDPLSMEAALMAAAAEAIERLTSERREDLRVLRRQIEWMGHRGGALPAQAHRDALAYIDAGLARVGAERIEEQG